MMSEADVPLEQELRPKEDRLCAARDEIPANPDVPALRETARQTIQTAISEVYRQRRALQCHR